MKTPILILKKIPGSDTPANSNAYGFDTIRIWQFNFDGKGTALVSWDNDDKLELLSLDDTRIIMRGLPGSGHRWYRPANLCFDDHALLCQQALDKFAEDSVDAVG